MALAFVLVMLCSTTSFASPISDIVTSLLEGNSYNNSDDNYNNESYNAARDQIDQRRADWLAKQKALRYEYDRANQYRPVNDRDHERNRHEQWRQERERHERWLAEREREKHRRYNERHNNDRRDHRVSTPPSRPSHKPDIATTTPTTSTTSTSSTSSQSSGNRHRQ